MDVIFLKKKKKTRGWLEGYFPSDQAIFQKIQVAKTKLDFRAKQLIIVNYYNQWTKDQVPWQSSEYHSP